MQIKTTMINHFTPNRIATFKRTENKRWQGCTMHVECTLVHHWWECKMVVTLEDSLPVAYKTKHTLPIKSRNCTPYYLSK